jgi:histone deacetylase HOS3
MDQLTSRVQRVKLNMPSKQEYDAKEKAKEAEKKAKIPRKAPAPKMAKPAVRKAPGRPPQVTKPLPPANQAEVFVPIAAPQVPEVEMAAIPPLEQPQPIAPVTSLVIEQPNALNARGENSIKTLRKSSGTLEPPAELMEISLEQLPVPPFLEINPLPLKTSPPRPDTPPPPPPSNINQIATHNTQTSATAQPLAEADDQTALQWLPPNTAAPASALANVPAMAYSKHLPSSAGTRQSLPVFTSSGTIPFAPPPNGAAIVPKAEPNDEPKDLWEVPETPAR